MNKKIGVGIFLVLIGCFLIIFFDSKFAILFSPPTSSSINSIFIFSLIILFAGVMFLVDGSLEEKISQEEKRGIIIVTGYTGSKRDYSDFLKRIRKYYPTQVISLKAKGKATGKAMLDQLIKSDKIARKNLGTDKVVYVGHSLGFHVLAEAERQHKIQALANIAIATYPSAGDCYNPNEDISKKTFLQRIINLLPNYSLLSFPIKKSSSKSIRTKFILGENDPVLYRGDSKEGVRRRFMNYFSQFPDSEVVVIPGDHGFNDPNDLSISRKPPIQPFNVSYPERLIDEIRDYVRKV